MFEGQLLHAVWLAALLAVVVAVGRSLDLAGEFLGLSGRQWLAFAVAVPVAHQVYVWFVWRSELIHSRISRWFGHPTGFSLYAVGFAVLFVARFLAVLGLALADRGSLALPAGTAAVLALLALLPALYLFYSVVRYFGLPRAFGIDHFDPAYRKIPLVRSGIFRFTRNGMYSFGFLALWVPALLLRSEAALLAALFQHGYIWTHYVCTERPDLRRIYGPSIR